MYQDLSFASKSGEGCNPLGKHRGKALARQNRQNTSQKRRGQPTAAVH